MSKVLLITGGARGIGAATALAATAAGWSVVVNYRSAEAEANAIVEAICKLGGTAIGVRADVSDEADVQAMFKQCLATYGRLDGLVNNAGILSQAARFETFSLERWSSVFSVNVTGTFLCTRAAARAMSVRRGGAGGSIVNLSSMAAVLGGAGEFVDYAASKGAIETLTIGLARELGDDGIRINAVRPGLIATDIHQSSGDPARTERLISTVPLGRLGSTEEVAQAIVWLLSDQASYTTGAVLSVSGGR